MRANDPSGTSGEGGKSVVFFYNDYESLGLEYISAVLKGAGIRTQLVYEDLVDFYAFDSKKTISKERCGRIAEKICAKNPDVLALSLLTDTFQINMIVAEQVKARDPGIRIIAGGVHASLLPQLVLGYPQIDAVAIGEGEYSMLRYVQNLDSIRSGAVDALEGIVYKQKGSSVGDFKKFSIQNDLDSIPYPDKDLFYREDASLKAHYFVQCSRGCPFVCSFCINDYLHQAVGGKRFRVRSPENIMEELLWAKEKYSPKFVALVDECFGIDLQWSKRLLELYKEKIRIPFLVSLHPHSVTAELADLLKEANCWYVAMGVQSLNEESSRVVLKRSLKRERVTRAIETIRSRGITLQCDHIFGIPGENEKDMLDALLFYNEHRPSLVSVYWLSYYPKSQIVQIARAKGLLSEQDVENIEHGRLGAGIKRVRGHHAINFWMNYLSFFPKALIRWVVKTGFFRIFNIKNFYISSAFPRVFRLLLNKKDWNRYYMKRIILKKMNNFRLWGPSQP